MKGKTEKIPILYNLASEFPTHLDKTDPTRVGSRSPEPDQSIWAASLEEVNGHEGNLLCLPWIQLRQLGLHVQASPVMTATIALDGTEK